MTKVFNTLKRLHYISSTKSNEALFHPQQLYGVSFALNGVSELPINQSLMNAAQDYSKGMYTSHKTRLECETVLANGCPHGFRSNLTVFTGTGLNKAAEKAVANWVRSSGHFEAMIDPKVDSIGVGVTTDGVKVCCYMFAGASHAYNPYAP